MKQVVVITGGGTGGHVYPGIAIAQAIKELAPQAEVHFVGATSGLETKIVPKSGFPLHVIPAGRLHASVSRRERLKTLLTMPWVLLTCLRLYLQLRPQAVIGVGGFASAPFLLVSSFLPCRTYLWEPNAFPGMANRWLSRFVDQCFVVFSEAQKHFKNPQLRVAGMPVRSEIASGARGDDDKFHVLVFGGSQGAMAINETVSSALARHPQLLEKICLIHQTGTRDFQRIREKYQREISAELQPAVQVLEYIEDMPSKYAWADLIFCRGGASSIAELAACGKAAVIIPFPQAADNHQMKNAEELVKAQAGALIEQANFTPQAFVKMVEELQQDEPRRLLWQQRIHQFHRAGAAKEIAKDLLRS